MSQNPPATAIERPAWSLDFAKAAKFEIAVLVLIVLSCSQIGYVGHPRYGPFVAVADVFCALLFLAWVYKVYREKRFRKLVLPPEPVIAWIGVSLLSISMAAVDAEGSLSLSGIKSGIIETAQIFLYFGAAYMIFVDILNSLAKVRRACLVLLATTSLVVLWGLVDYLISPEAVDVASSFGNRNVYSAFLLIVIPLLFGLAIHGRDRILRIWTCALAVVAVVTMLGPPHVWLLAGLLVWVAYVRGGRYRAVYVPAIIVVTLAACLVLPRNYLANVQELLDPYERGELFKLEAATEEAGDEPAGESPLIVKKRWLEWQPALTMLSENLALGVGAGSFQKRIGEAAFYGGLPNVKKSEPDTNNFYLVMGASMGLAGLVCVVALLAWAWRRATTLWLRAGGRFECGLAAGLSAAILGIALANIFTSLFVRGISIIWALVLAMIMIATREGIAAVGRDATRQ